MKKCEECNDTKWDSYGGRPCLLCGGDNTITMYEDVSEENTVRFCREDYIKCVLIAHADVPDITWCGRKVFQSVEFLFQDATHAILNARNEGRLLTCKKCAKAISKQILAHVG